MSANEDDFEHALWNNNFYSSPAVLTESSSSNHITNLRQTVNLPTSSSLQSLHGHVAGTIESRDSRKLAAENSTQTQNVRKTSLMRVSPSMKALENALNGDTKPVAQHEAIAEEEEEEQEEEEMGENGGKPEEREQRIDVLDPSYQKPGSRASVFSVSTFHTAKSSETLTAAVPESLPSRHASVATIEAPIHLEEDITPKLAPSASFLPSKSDDISSNGAAGSPVRETTGENGQKPEIGTGSLVKMPWDTPETSTTPKTMTASASCPAISPKNFEMPQTPRAQVAPKTDQSPSVSNKEMKRASPKKQAPVRSLLDSPFVTSAKPSAKLPSKPSSSSTTTYSTSQSLVSPVKSSSAFATPRSQAASLKNSSPRKSLSDAGLPQSPSFYGHQRSATDGASQSSNNNKKPVNAEPKPANNKRFSFRGLFKIKSKNHSLSKLKNIDEELKHGSKPVKLSAKSYSTPNMATLVQEEKQEKKKGTEQNGSDSRSKPQYPENNGRKRFFGRKSFSGDESGLALGAGPDKSGENSIAGNEVNTAKPAPLTKSQSEFLLAPPALSFDPDTPAISSSVFSADTPSTAHLDSKRNTIREVDDSDYSPNFTRDSPTPSVASASSEKAASLKEAFEEPQRESDLRSEEISPYIPPANMLNQESPSKSQFGSPFKISFPLEKPDYNPRSPMSLRYQAPQSPSRSVNSRVSNNEQLVGEALFPKLLDANEVESIVTLERSRSMRSIRSSNKRSSFINYNGSDENIILGKNLTAVSNGSMKRSGSILKNSPSAQSLRPDMYQSIDKTFEDDSQLIPPTLEEDPVKVEQSAEDLDYADFIEFSDYIDFDNLDFSTSPIQEPYQEPNQGYLSPSFGDYLNYEPEKNESPMPNTAHIDPPSNVETSTVVDTSTAIDTSVSLDNSEVLKSIPEVSHGDLPEVIHVASNSGLSKVSSPDLHVDTANVSLDPAPNASPLDKTFQFAIQETTRGNEVEKAPRPVSMSFKGFSGSAFKDRVLPQSGSHQSIHFDDESFDDASGVGQGFGSSGEDSDNDDDDDGDDSFDEHEGDQNFHAVSQIRKGPKKMTSFDRRQQHMKNVLDLQPPSASVPFHHNRIPSISDQSSTSSPKSLSSFISRIRKSPMPSPKLAPSKPSVKFSSRIILYDTYHHDEYDRHPEIATCNQLTPLLAQQIKEELNELKSNMEVHQDSICYTQFF